MCLAQAQFPRNCAEFGGTLWSGRGCQRRREAICGGSGPGINVRPFAARGVFCVPFLRRDGRFSFMELVCAALKRAPGLCWAFLRPFRGGGARCAGRRGLLPPLSFLGFYGRRKVAGGFRGVADGRVGTQPGAVAWGLAVRERARGFKVGDRWVSRRKSPSSSSGEGNVTTLSSRALSLAQE